MRGAQNTWQRRTSQSARSDGRDRGDHQARRFGDMAKMGLGTRHGASQVAKEVDVAV